MKQISSLQNPLIKHCVLLQEKAKTRKSTNSFLIEGLRELSIAIKGNYIIETILFCPDLLCLSLLQKQIDTSSCEIIELTKEVYQKIAYRESTEGVIAIAKGKNTTLDELKLSKNPLILIAESPEKPGNIGAILRTADAANLDAVIIANPKGDLYNPNIIRSSIGTVFTNQIAMASTSEIIRFLKEKEISIYSAILQEAVPYHTINYTTPTAIVVGTEATGLSEEWRSASTQNIIIPMEGAIDSMNVSVAASVLIFEAKRQRLHI